MPVRRLKRPKDGLLKNFEEEEMVGGSFMVPAHYYEALQEEAREQSVSVAHIIRQSIKKYFDQKKEAEESEESEEEGEEEAESEEGEDW